MERAAKRMIDAIARSRGDPRAARGAPPGPILNLSERTKPHMLQREQFLSIERPHTRCDSCDVLIEGLDHHPSGLTMTEETTKRFDYCPDCWERIKAGAFDSYWLTRRIKKDKRQPKLTRREKAVAARALFESLWDQRDREDVEADLFFIAHLLLKWGGLKWKKNAATEDGREVVFFENPATGDSIEIKAVELSDEMIEAIKARIESFLHEYAPENDMGTF